MTNTVKTLPIIDNANREQIRVQLLYHNVFRQLKKSRKQFSLTTNECLVLNGAFLYVFLVKADFTIGGLTPFITYYNKKLIRYYIDKLISKGYFAVHRVSGVVVYYRLTSLAYEVVQTMFNDVDIMNRKFCEKYNVSL